MSFLLVLLPWSATGLSCARTVALEFVAKNGQHDLSPLSGRDRSLARMLGSTCLRHMGEIDAEIRRFYQGKASMDVLRLGVTQIRYCDKIPDRAAVHESVELAKKTRANPGLCNAVLRKIAAAEPLRPAPELNASPWLRKRVASQCDNPSRFFALQAEEPTFDMSCADPNRSGHPPQGFRRLECGSLRAEPGTLFPLDEACFAQDAAAAAAGRVALASLSESETTQSRKVLDACAAPGGKTMQLAAAGYDVTAVEMSEERAIRLRENLDRLGLSSKVEVVTTDARIFDDVDRFDLVLLDAPCTCTGTGRRHPEVLRKTGFGRLLKTQRELLEACFELTKKGGCLVYSTCSVTREENEEQISQFLTKHEEVAEVWPIKSLDGFRASAFTTDGFLRIFPWDLVEENEWCDSHFVARLLRLS